MIFSLLFYFTLVIISLPLFAGTDVLTAHTDNARTGLIETETVLNRSNVRAATFGKVCSTPVDGQIYAEPLVVSNVDFVGSQAPLDVVYVATMNDSVYAINAADCSVLRKVSLVPVAGGCIQGKTCEQPVQCAHVGGGGCATISPIIGILSTPVIKMPGPNDTGPGTLYLVAETQVGADNSISAWYHRLHALQLDTLSERADSPIVIGGDYMGRQFVSKDHVQRPGLLLTGTTSPPGHTLYIAFSLMDGSPNLPRGWMFGYSADLLTPQPPGLPYVFTTTPTGVSPSGPGGGIWQGGAGLAYGADSANSSSSFLFFGTGDGTFDAFHGGPNYADTFLKLTPNLQVDAYFTRSNEFKLPVDTDYGSGGVLLIPPNVVASHPYLAVNGSKDGNIYVVDRAHPGGYNASRNTNVETITGTGVYHDAPAFFNQHVYIAPVAGPISSFRVSDTCNPGPLCTPPDAIGKVNFKYGATPSISWNGTDLKTAIVWGLWTPGQPSGGTAAVLYAFTADTLSTIYSANSCPVRDAAGLGVKFSVPTVANGRVYVGTQTELDVYGLLKPGSVCQ